MSLKIWVLYKYWSFILFWRRFAEFVYFTFYSSSIILIDGISYEWKTWNNTHALLRKYTRDVIKTLKCVKKVLNYTVIT